MHTLETLRRSDQKKRTLGQFLTELRKRVDIDQHFDMILEEKAYARGSGGSTCCGECGPALLSGLADQHLVRNRGDAGADAEESIEGCVPCAAPIEAEHELIEDRGRDVHYWAPPAVG